MGRSLRRIKRTAPKARVGVQKRTRAKGKTPTPVEYRLEGNSEDWASNKTLRENYAATGLLVDPNAAFGRNANSDPLQAAARRRQEHGDTHDDDDELRAASGQARKSGKAPPPRLTGHQRKIVQQLVDAHGDDLQAMVLDRKLNSAQHSAGKLRQLIAALHFWSPHARHDFRAPKKPFKKL